MRDIITSLFAVAPSLGEGSRATSGYVLVRCPFHGGGQEKTPSMSVSREKPIYFCHSCGESGHISKVFRLFGASKEAVDLYLANAGMNIPYQKAPIGKVAGQYVKGLDPFKGNFILDDEILDAYRQAPTSLREAGFSLRTMRHFEVGYDMSQMRITYPIRNIYGDLIGVSGRAIIDGMEPRYKIYKQELIDRKDFRVPPAYSMDSAKEATMWHAHIVCPYLLGNNAPLVIVEGFKACMWVWQSGYQATVALVGAYLSDFHSEIVATHTREAVLFLDNNEAGYKGAFFGARKLLERGVDVRIVQYPDSRPQPDDLSPEEVIDSIDNAVTYSAWRGEHRDVTDEASRRIRIR